jgi:hypothetical protein
MLSSLAHHQWAYELDASVSIWIAMGACELDQTGTPHRLDNDLLALQDVSEFLYYQPS